MARSQINLQDAFLNHVRKEKIPVVIDISGGGKIEGLVKGFDNFVILVKGEGQRMVYKHAVSAITPERPVELNAHHPQAGPSGTGGGEAEKPAEKPAAKPAEKPVETPAEAPIKDDTETPAPPPDDGEPWVEG